VVPCNGRRCDLTMGAKRFVDGRMHFDVIGSGARLGDATRHAQQLRLGDLAWWILQLLQWTGGGGEADWCGAASILIQREIGRAFRSSSHNGIRRTTNLSEDANKFVRHGHQCTRDQFALNIHALREFLHLERDGSSPVIGLPTTMSLNTKTLFFKDQRYPIR
jgi:hypothetical protein